MQVLGKQSPVLAYGSSFDKTLNWKQKATKTAIGRSLLLTLKQLVFQEILFQFTFKYITSINTSISTQVFPHWHFHHTIQKLLIRLIASK